ncbi:UNKNOWN [Stylonychia lemnae]|uniref:Uncharacterized protein n=1 Tax=Stylonychia lemnae TaxID=5949 RepID=A0A078B3H6_STYLE|nr:UNKNOWN [Stylonychia lemnae]|eukprot:CDW88806.1 UNKNOWN [Stylonychia lemnae]
MKQSQVIASETQQSSKIRIGFGSSAQNTPQNQNFGMDYSDDDEDDDDDDASDSNDVVYQQKTNERQSIGRGRSANNNQNKIQIKQTNDRKVRLNLKATNNKQEDSDDDINESNGDDDEDDVMSEDLEQINQNDEDDEEMSESEFESSDSDAPKKGKRGNRQKNQDLSAQLIANQIDLEKLTKRQRMAYLNKQNEQEKQQQQQIAIGKHNRESLLSDPHNDNVFYALAHKKPIQKVQIDNEEESQEKPLKKRGPGRTSVNQQQADEIKRLQLEKLLDDQKKKFQDREKKLQALGAEILGQGTVGRYINQNQRLIMPKQKIQQCGPCIKTIYKDNNVKMVFPQGIMLPEVLRQKINIHELENKMVQRQEMNQCSNCGTHQKKYVCSKTHRVACSFECYKLIQSDNMLMAVQ